MKVKAIAGGAATAGGMDFQHRVAAWATVYILAEKDATPLWNLSADTTLEWLQCETKQPVDDLQIGTSDDRLLFAQCKRTLKLLKGDKSDLASVLDQFVRQFIARQSKTTGTQALDRPLDPERDRLVIVTSPTSSEKIRLNFKEILDRVRHLHPNHPMDKAERNDMDHDVLSVVKAHVARSWQNVSGADPSDDEFRQFLSLIHLQVLDLDEGGTNENEAKNLLRTAVLRDPEKAEVAWSLLVSLCAGFATHQSGTDRKILTQDLLNAGIDLQVARSYRPDIERLKEHSKSIVESLAHLARIRIGSTEVKIRRHCTEVLKLAVEEKSILVVGEPGAGKSGALHHLVETLKEQVRDYVFLAVDRLDARSLGGLRGEIGLNHELIEVLDNWPGLQPAFLVIDALDAARVDPAGRMIRDLIRRIVERNGRWHVVASIRKFDLRYGEEIKQLFVGDPPSEFQDAEFSHVRHLNIPCLSVDEVNQISPQSSELYALIKSAPTELFNLLSVPFNLQLIAELLGTGDTCNELLPIRTQLGLLDQYWLRRVIHSNDDTQGDAREAVLREVCEKMVAKRALHVDRFVVARTDTSGLLLDLLSMQVLIEWQSSPIGSPDHDILAFGHNILFDYAVARLLLRGSAERVVHRLLDDSDLVIVIRPSLMLHFRHLWNFGIPPFWDLVFRVNRAAGIPEIGKLIGPSVAAELARALSDLEPLFSALNNPHIEIKSTSEQVLWHLFGALSEVTHNEKRLVGRDAGPWCELIECISRSLRPHVAYTVQSLLTIISEHTEDLTPEQRIATGQTARQLFEFAWSQMPRDRRMVINALQCVCRTFESNPGSSARLIRQCLEPLHLSQFGFEEIPFLAEEVKLLIPLDPGLVEEIYRVTFSHHETSNAQTPIGQSLILPLTSNRRQDYKMALYKLAEFFPQFLECSPERATCALIAVMEAYVAQDHPLSSGGEHEEVFDFNGIQARLLTDYSAIWDHNVYRQDKPLQMLDAFQRYLEELAKKHDCIEQLRALVKIILSENRLAVLWSRLLLLGSRFPSTLGREILPLSWTKPFLIGFDTRTHVGELLIAIFPTLDREERERIERSILIIPVMVPWSDTEAGERIRNRLLGCLSNESIVTADAKSLLEELKIKNAVPPNEQPMRFSGVMNVAYSEKEYLAGSGVPVEAEANRKIQELECPVKVFVDEHRNSDPTLVEVHNIHSTLRELHSALSSADADGIHSKQRDYGWGYLTDACACVAKIEMLSNDDEICGLIKSVLLEASHYPEPTQNPEDNAQFDEHPAWGLPAPRIEAAKGLVLLARHPTVARSDVLEAIERLSKDPVPAVRFQIASYTNAIYKTAQKFMWQIIESMCYDELSRGVLCGLLGGPIGRLAGVEPNRIAGLTKAIFDRVKEGPGATEVRGLCVDIFSDLCIWRGHVLCDEIAREISRNPATYPDEAHHVLMKLRKPLTYGPTDRDDPVAEAVRRRAFDLLAGLLRSGRENLLELEKQNKMITFNEWSQHDKDMAKSFVSLMDSLGSEFYFASGAYDRERNGLPGTVRTIKPESERFYREASTIFDELADVSIPSVAHRLLETLGFFIPLEPHEVFLRIGRVVRSGKQAGYQHESLAVDLVVKLVERYLAEYRALLSEDEKCRIILVEILDVFVQAGWPSARRLTYRLGEIFR